MILLILLIRPIYRQVRTGLESIGIIGLTSSIKSISSTSNSIYIVWGGGVDISLLNDILK